MMHRTVFLVTTLILTLTAAHADMLTLRNGQKVQGTYLGGTVSQIQFQNNGGKTLSLNIGDVAGMTFTAPSPPPPPPAATGPAIQVPAGTMINVRIIDAINVD